MKAMCAMGVSLFVGAPAIGQVAESLGPAPLTFLSVSTGRISAIIASPTDAELYFAGGADAGVWRTTNGGATWEALTDQMPTTAIGALAFDPTDESIVYAGTGEANYANHSRYGLGLYKSVDGGDSWMHLAEGTFAGRCFSRIVVDNETPETIYASITRAGGFPELAAAKGHPQAAGPVGVLKSIDGGQTWSHLTNGLPALSATDLAIDPSNSDILYAAIGHIFGDVANGIYKTTNGGASWTKISNALPFDELGRISIAVSPDNPLRVAALLTNESSSSGGGASSLGVYLSQNGGATWQAVGDVSQASYGWYLSTISFRPGHPDTIIAGGLDLSRIVVGQGTFDITPPHVDLHAIAWDAAGRLVVGDDGGVHRSDDVGNDWESRNMTLSSVQFYAGLSTHPTNDEFVIAGAQDNGSNRRTTDTQFWTTVAGGDGGWTQVDQASPNRMFTESQGTGNIYFSSDGGDDFDWSGEGIDGGDRNCFLPPYLIDPTDSSRMLYATHRIYRSINGGQSWSPISGDLTRGNGAIRALALAPSSPEVMYAATNDGNVLVSVEGGSEWDLVLDDHPGWPRVTRELTVHPSDPGEVYLAGAVFGVDQVRRSRDFGQTWESLDGDLPDIPVNVIGVDGSGVEPVIYAGSDAGLWRSLDEGVTWHRYGEGFPSAAVIDILVDPTRGRLIVGTQGRGAWEVPIVTCVGDANGDGSLDVLDFIAFQMMFVRGEPGADCNADGSLNVLDFLCFQQAWKAGCG